MTRRVLMAEVSGGRVQVQVHRGVRPDGWCEGGLGQQSNDSGGCAKDRKELIALLHM